MVKAKDNMELAPKLRFSGFDDKYKRDQLLSFLKLITYGFTNPMPEDECGPYMLTAKDIKEGRILYESCRRTSYEAYGELLTDKSRPVIGDILLTKDGTLGRLAVAGKKKCCINQSVALLRPEESVLSKYLKYLLESSKYQGEMLRNVGGSTIKHIYITVVDKMFVNVPTLPEQEKIVSFISAVDKKIEQLTTKKKLLEQYKKGVMQKIFSQQIRFKDDNGKNCPDWQEKKLGDMLVKVIDNRGKTPPVTDSGILLIEVNALGNRLVDYSKVGKYVSEDTYNDWFRGHIESGDVLFSTVGSTAVCSLYDATIKSAIAQNIVGLRYASENNSFLLYLLTEKRNNHEFKRIEMVAVQPSVKVSQMIHIKFDVPSLLEQDKIASFLSGIDKKTESVQSQINQTQTFKKGLLQQLFV